MAERYNISLDEKFTPEFQDNLAILKLNERWLQQFQKDGDVKQFQRNLSAEWASLPKDESGLSYYHWDGLNHALVPHDALVKQIRAIWQMS
jgi:muramidase (phage lysozyme)